MSLFNTVALHPFTECNMNCPFCYKKKSSDSLPQSFFVKLMKELKGMTTQVACGGGEPFLKPEFIMEMAHQCRRNNIYFNVTTNGKPLLEIAPKDFKDLFRDITMVSISFDRYKVKTAIDVVKYLTLVNAIKKYAGIEVGCNLLVDEQMFLYNSFLRLVSHLFKHGVDRVFALYPKNIKGFDIRKYVEYYGAASLMFPKFYVDDLTRKLLEEGYKWKTPCHYGNRFISINEHGAVTGCSFDDESKAVIVLKEPKDILKMKKLQFEKRYNCPYLNLKGVIHGKT